MSRAAVVLAGALLLIVAWALCREQQRVAASWREDEDGVQPVDPYLESLGEAW